MPSHLSHLSTRREFVASAVGGVVGLSAFSTRPRQNKTETPDLAALLDAKRLTIVNRTATRLTEGPKRGLRLSENPGDGVALIDGITFANGTIECDLRGKDVAQQSFIGLAFHGVDGITFDGVYFRPFNFKAAEAERRGHSVQYISHPTYTWQKLRSEQPGKYEQPVNPVPDPNDWFHARIVVASPKVSVYVNDAAAPSLVVDQLSNRGKGLVGLWVGNTSGGDFANLKITHA
jgi:hypothetical protein